jgi:hypothetical protein
MRKDLFETVSSAAFGAIFGGAFLAAIAGILIVEAVADARAGR